MENIKLPTPAQFDRTLKIINCIHATFAGLSLLMFVWTFTTSAVFEAKVWSIFAFLLFVGLFFHTKSVRQSFMKRNDGD